jgi:anti-sigma B factor antagonist
VRLADVTIETTGRLVVARLDGEIDLSNATEIGAVIANGVPNEALALVIDLTKVDYVDSAGIHVLFELRDRLKTRGQEIGLVVSRDAEIIEALRYAYLPEVVAVFESLDAATESFADASGESKPIADH